MENSKNSKLDPSNQFRGILNTHFLRPTSKHLYIIKLTKLMNITGMNMDEIIHSPEEITNLVEDMDITDSTRVSFISSIMAYFIYNNIIRVVVSKCYFNTMITFQRIGNL